MLNFFDSNALETVLIFTFFLERSCRKSFTHSVKPSSATVALHHLSVNYIIIRFFLRHSTATIQHYFYRFFLKKKKQLKLQKPFVNNEINDLEK